MITITSEAARYALAPEPGSSQACSILVGREWKPATCSTVLRLFKQCLEKGTIHLQPNGIITCQTLGLPLIALRKGLGVLL